VETKTGRGRGAKFAIAASIALHGALVYYVYETKFVPHYKAYSDEAIVAELVQQPKPPPPPPPEEAAPPPAPQEAAPPPPALTPHFTPLPSVPLAAPIIPIAPSEPTPPPPVAPPVPEPAAPAPRAIANPQWSSRPSGEDVARFYPERAQRQGREGRVALDCQVTAKGAVAGCVVVSEEPQGFGFGEAALKLSRLFKMKPRMEDGQAVEGASVRIPITFRLAK